MKEMEHICLDKNLIFNNKKINNKTQICMKFPNFFKVEA